MGSVQSNITCPCCKFNAAIGEFNTRTYSETVFCERCGRWEQKDLVSDQSIKEGGFGSYRVTLKSGGSRLGSFRMRRPIKARIASVAKAIATPRVKHVEITVRERGRWKTLVLKGKQKRTRILDKHYPLHQAPVRHEPVQVGEL